MKDSKRYFLDTSIFLRVLVRENEESFKECTQLLEAINSGLLKGYASVLVIVEVSWVLSRFYKFSKKEMIRAVSSILALKNFTVKNGSDIHLALALYEAKNIKFVDAILATHPLVQQGMPVVSYDRDFHSLGVIRKVPGEVLRSLKK